MMIYGRIFGYIYIYFFICRVIKNLNFTAMLVILSEYSGESSYSLAEFPASYYAESYFPLRIRNIMHSLGNDSIGYLVHRDDFTTFMKYVISHSASIVMLPGNRICCHYDCKRKYIQW